MKNVFSILSTCFITLAFLSSCASKSKLTRGYGGKWEDKTADVLEQNLSNTENNKEELIQEEQTGNGYGLKENGRGNDVPPEIKHIPNYTKKSADFVIPFVTKNKIKQTETAGISDPKKGNKKSGEEPPKGKSQLVALLFCFFLGNFGVHRFYLGYPLIGVLQILTLGGFGIWVIIDLIFIITGDLKPKNGEYTETLQSISKKSEPPTKI